METNCHDMVNFALFCLSSYLKVLLVLTAGTDCSGLKVASTVGGLACISVDLPAFGEPVVICML